MKQAFDRRGILACSCHVGEVPDALAALDETVTEAESIGLATTSAESLGLKTTGIQGSVSYLATYMA